LQQGSEWTFFLKYISFFVILQSFDLDIQAIDRATCNVHFKEVRMHASCIVEAYPTNDQCSERYVELSKVIRISIRESFHRDLSSICDACKIVISQLICVHVCVSIIKLLRYDRKVAGG
jgi:hypothetical protein